MVPRTLGRPDLHRRQPKDCQGARRPAKALGRGSGSQEARRSATRPPLKPDGDGAITLTGDLETWHNVTLNLDGPYAHELDNQPNAFTDALFNPRDGSISDASAMEGKTLTAPDTGDWLAVVRSN